MPYNFDAEEVKIGTKLDAIRKLLQASDPAQGIRPSDRRERHYADLLPNIAERLRVYHAMASYPDVNQEELALEHAERVINAVLGITRGVR